MEECPDCGQVHDTHEPEEGFVPSQEVLNHANTFFCHDGMRLLALMDKLTEEMSKLPRWKFWTRLRYLGALGLCQMEIKNYAQRVHKVHALLRQHYGVEIEAPTIN